MTHIETKRLESLLRNLDNLDLADSDYITIGLLLKILETLSKFPRVEK